MKASKDYADIIGGALMMAGGVWFTSHALNYNIGSLRRMGPGYFPVCIGILIAVFGLVLLLPALRRPGTMPVPEWRPLLWICAGIFAFTVMVERFGLVPATVALTLLAAMAENAPRPVTTVVLAAALSLIGVVIFTWGLGIPMPAFRWSH